MQPRFTSCVVVLVLVAVLTLSLTGCRECCTCSEPEFPTLSGDYLGQPLPGAEPQLFAPGIVATGMYERDMAISPDGDEIYYTAVLGGFNYATILLTRRVEGQWTRPEVAPFATDPRYRFIEPHISPDGKRFFFVTNRPLEGEEPGDENIWVMDRTADGWGEPFNLGGPHQPG